MAKFKKADGESTDVGDNDTVMLKIDGELREVSMGDLLTSASKASGADAVFRQAAAREKAAEAQMKEAEGALRLKELVGREEGMAQGEFFEYMRLLGTIPEAEFADRWNFYSESLKPLQEGGDPAAEGDTGDEGQQAPAQDPEARETIRQLQQQLVEQNQTIQTLYSHASEGALKTSREKIREAIDNDSKLGKLDSGVRNELGNLMETAISKQLAVTKGPLDEGVLAHGISRVKEQGEALKILPSEKQEADAATGLGVAAGLGPAEAAAVGQAASTGTPIERVPATDPNYADNFAAKTLAEDQAGLIPELNEQDS